MTPARMRQRLYALHALVVVQLFALAPCAAHADAASAPPTHVLHDFAFGITLTPREPRAVHSARLPLEVYRGVTRDDLGDLRVFNAAGEQVPHALRTLDASRPLDAEAVALPLFPLRAQPGAEPSTSTAVLDALALRIERDGRGAIVELRLGGSDRQAASGAAAAEDAGAPDAGPSTESILAYVLDASALPRPIEALHVQLADAPGDYVLPVRIEASEDLASFSPIGGEQALVRLSHAGERIERDRIELSGVSARYLRLRWSTEALPAPIERVRAVLASDRSEAPLAYARVPGVQRDRAQGEGAVYDFDLQGPVPADRVRVLLPHDNTVVEAELSSSPSPSGPFRAVQRGTLYRITRQGESLSSSALAIARRSDRYWRLTVEAKGGGLGGALPELEVGYHPDQLLFVARGQAPFTLAYGRYDAQPASFAASELLAPLPLAERDELDAAAATTSAQRTLAGPSARSAPPPPPPLKRYALWTVLVLGVGLLGITAIRLARSL